MVDKTKKLVVFENITKEYIFSGQNEQKNTLRDEITFFFRKIFKKSNNIDKSKSIFKALNNLSFTVFKGQTIALIGHNGAGKSTLLKMITGIILPTSGRLLVDSNIRIISLLEVGAGFHSELSGRENIFLNGSILGFSTKEIQSKIPAIVEFSGIGDFIDLPVKKYSSGMKARLGFSITTQLEADLVIIDETLSVGDQNFKEKSLNFLKERKEKGQTLIIASHSTSLMKDIADYCIHLDRGAILNEGDPEVCIDHYISLKKTSSPTQTNILSIQTKKFRSLKKRPRKISKRKTLRDKQLMR